MAALISLSPSFMVNSSQFLSSKTSNSLQIKYKNQVGGRTRRLCVSIRAVQSGVQKEDIVIVGAGIAGLATALSLHKLGVRAVVLEQAESLRTSGTSLTLFKNGWSVLDALGVANELRPQFLEIQAMTIRTENGRELRSFRFKDEDASQEVRGVQRRTLLEALSKQLPSDSIRFDAGLAKIERSESNDTLLELENGTKIAAKIVIGCDGIRSQVARWMGYSEPKFVGECAFRGIGEYPDGHSYESKVNYIYGKGTRAGYVPLSPTKVYWFISFNSSTPGTKNTDSSAQKKQALNLANYSPKELLKTIELTPADTIIKSPVMDRWLWPASSPSASSQNIVLVGEAWHPITPTPSLGQGACCALEDSVILARKIAEAVKTRSCTVEEAIKSYESERWPKIFLLAIYANVIRAFLQWDNPLVCSIRDNVIVPKLTRLGPMLEHTNFKCEPFVR